MSLAPVLNYDILLEVMKKLPKPDCARFMRTSRFFYTHGFEALLSHNVSIYTEEDLIRFLECLQKEPDKRCRHVRSMRLNFYDFTQATALKLADALRRMSNLEALSIKYSEVVIPSHPDLHDAFAALTSLRELNLSFAGEHAFRMLRSLRSELVSVRVHLFDTSHEYGLFDWIPADERPLYHPAVHLKHSRSSLQELSLYHWYMDTDAVVDPALVYPQVWQLNLQRSLFPRTLPLINAYPSLTHLRFHTGESDRRMYSQSNLDAYDARHALNVSAQLDADRTWASLHEYRGPLMDLYLLGLTCTIDSVYLCSSGSPSHLPDMLPPALAYARPRDLTLEHWPMQLKYDHGPLADMFAGLREQGGSRLETFCIEERLDQYDINADIAVVLEGLRVSLLSAPLQELRMQIGVYTDREGAGCVCFTEHSGKEFDLSDYVRRFMEDVPTLRRANMVLVGLKDPTKLVTIVDGKVQIQEAPRYR